MTAPATQTAAGYLILDAAYRAATARASLAMARLMLAYWRAVQADNLAGTSPQWLERAIPLVVRGQAEAVAAANSYTNRVRILAAPNAPLFTPPNPRPPNLEQIRTSLEFTAIKSTAREFYRLENSILEPEKTPEERESDERTLAGGRDRLMQDAINRAVGSAIRQVTTAGRDQLEDNVLADDAAIGWMRTTKPGCCYFCAMLASRGLVYKSDSFEFSNELFKGAGEQKVHDHCGCGLRPVYAADDPLPDRTDRLETMWIDSQRERRRDETAVNAFRRMYEASDLYQPITE